MRLGGTHADVERWRDILLGRGYRRENIHILWDKPGITSRHEEWPSTANILKAVSWLTSDVHDGQYRFFFFGGHRKGVLPDGSDSAFLGIDIENPLKDEDLELQLIGNLTSHSRLTVVLDSCRIGNILAIPWHLHWSGSLQRATTLRNGGELQWFHGHVLVIGAARRTQSAREVLVKDSNSTSGALTYHLTQRLRVLPTVSLANFLTDVNRSLQPYKQEIIVTTTSLSTALLPFDP